MQKFLLTLCAAVAMATTASAQLAEKIAGQYAGDLYISLGEEINDEIFCEKDENSKESTA